MGELARLLRREPLVWFLVSGLLLFGFHALVSPDTDDAASRVIEVERSDVLQFMQLRARSFNEAVASARLENLAPEEVTLLVKDLVREEAMYREALRLGLDRNDYVMRRRLVQSLDYIAAGRRTVQAEADEAALRRYYEANRQRYAAAPSVSFSHVFFSVERHGWDGAERLAANALDRLNRVPEGSDVPPGDRFAYFRNYVARSRELIEDHFDEGFAQSLFDLTADEARWQGPLRSQHGFHLVRIVDVDRGRPLSFAQARNMVAEDAAVGAKERQREAFVASLLAKFDVNISNEVRRLMKPAS